MLSHAWAEDVEVPHGPGKPPVGTEGDGSLPNPLGRGRPPGFEAIRSQSLVNGGIKVGEV